MYQKSISYKLNYVTQRINNVLKSLYCGHGVLVFDNENRENECDIIFSAEKITIDQIALMIQYCSGIICLCLTNEYCYKLKLPMMINCNNSKYHTSFTISIESIKEITTGVSASDRLRTMFSVINDDFNLINFNKPGHIFPLCTQSGGILKRKGHTESSIDLLTMIGLKPIAILCEITNINGSMARKSDVDIFSYINNMNIITVKDILLYRKNQFYI